MHNSFAYIFHSFSILVALFAGCLSCSNRNALPVATYETISSELTHPRVVAIAEDGTGHIWVGTTHGLNRAMPYGYHQYLAGEDTLSLSDNHISGLFRDTNGRLWISTLNGRVCYLTQEDSFVPVGIEYHGTVLISFLELPDGTLLCNNEYGIFRYLPGESRMERLLDGDTHNLGAFACGNTILVIYPERMRWYSAEGRLLKERVLPEPCSAVSIDPDGDLWMGVDSGRKLEIRRSDTGEPVSVPAAFSERMAGKSFPDFLPYDGDGHRILVNTMDNLLVLDKTTWSVQTAREVGIPLDSGQYNINCIHSDADENIWVGLDGGGVRLLPNNRKGTQFHVLLDFFKDMPIRSLSFDEEENNLYIVTGKNVTYQYSLLTGRIQQVKTSRPIPDLVKDSVLILSNGDILTAGNNKDLIISSQDGKTATLLDVKRIMEAIGGDHFIPEALREDSRGQVWIGTQSDGVIILDPKTHRFKRVSAISCPEITSIMTVGETVWVATQYGLNEYDLNGMLINSYLAGSGLNNNAFTEHCACVLPGDILVLGTMQGLVVRYPSSDAQAISLPFFCEDLRVQNRLIKPGAKSPVGKALVFSPEIRLRHDWNHFSISFCALDYRNIIHGSYSYMLEGFDPVWVDAGDAHEAFYSNIPPGKYTFRARLSDKGRDWSYGSAAVDVVILPAPWATWWAKTLYVLLSLGLLYFILYSRMRYSRGREKLRRAEEEKRQEQHVSEINKQYFANVAHQLRTPLTMILGPIGTLSSSDTVRGESRNLLRIVRHNVDRMINLVNQIMDFNALETDALSLQVRWTDILPILRNTLDIYRINADEKGIRFLTDGLDGNAFIFADADKIVNILDNLLSNAIKHTPQGGYISVSFTCLPEWNVLEVANSGPVIPEDKLEKIFERYYQIDKDSQGRLNWGSGVGLYYSRRLAQLHHGSLACRNAEDDASVCFELRLPVPAEAYRPEEMVAGKDQMVQPVHPVEKPVLDTTVAIDLPPAMKPKILVVDDDTDITFYLRTLLAPFYQVHCCYDVETALEDLRSRTPDLILSDILMNGKTGYDLCRILKEDLQYSHIPVILLTAKNSVRDQIDGLNVGADAYVTKPFHAEYLLSLIDNLLKGRERLRAALSDNAGLELSSDNALAPQDKAFLKDLYAMMEEELSNSEFNIGDIVDKMHISHSKFLYKVKGLTGVTPSELFKNYKLNKAAALLREGKYNVSEVSDLTGFSSLAHFSKVFKKKFGIPPSELK